VTHSRVAVRGSDWHQFARLHRRRAARTPKWIALQLPYTAWSLVHSGSFDLRPFEAMRPHVGTTVRVTADGAWVSMRAPGAALTAVPIIAPFCAGSRPTISNPKRWILLGKLAAALSVAGAAGLFFAACRRLVPEAAWPATILFALGSSLCSVASQSLWMHGPRRLLVVSGTLSVGG